MGETVRLEELQALLQLTVEYKDVLRDNLNVLQNAAKVCSAVLSPNDRFAQSYIDQLNELLRYLAQTIDIAEENCCEMAETIRLYSDCFIAD